MPTPTSKSVEKDLCLILHVLRTSLLAWAERPRTCAISLFLGRFAFVFGRRISHD
jgi:hypothetical protein